MQSISKWKDERAKSKDERRKEKGERRKVKLERLRSVGNLGIILKLTKLTSHPPYSTHSHHANCHLDTCLLTQAFAGLIHPQSPASAGDVSRGYASGEVAGTTDCGLRK